METEKAIEDIKRICEYLIESDYMSIDKSTKISLETMLQEFRKQEKMIDTIITELAYYDNYICHSIECKDIGCKECLKQYFKKKAEESE